MNKVFKEPLVAFLFIGVAIFALFQQVSDDALTSDTEIVVTAGRIQVLTLSFEKVWQRLPSARELEGLIQNYVREEVLYREALAMGLGRDDPVVKRRLVQKLEFLSEDMAALDDPAEQELLVYLAAHQERYRQPSRFSFRQVYLNSSRRGDNIQGTAIKLLTKLQANDSDAETLGDPLMLSHQFERMPETEIEQVLGGKFLQYLRETPTGSWQGPIASGFGLHLVRIDERIDGKPPSLNAVREQVVRDWTALQRKQTNADVYESLRKRYKVTVASYASADSDIERTIKFYMNRILQ